MAKVSVETRFWLKVDKSEDCWEWTGGKFTKGYGKTRIGSRYAHRVAYEFTFGPIPKGLCVLHKCDNPPCCNPEHLFLGTQQENMKDMVQKKRSNIGEVNPMSVLTEEQVSSIRAEYSCGKVGYKKLAKKYGANWSTIRDVIKRNTWPHIG